MSRNANLVDAKINRNDEFYTQIEDIEKELLHYPNAFAGKRIYLPCDDYRTSQFWKFFTIHADELKWSSLTASTMCVNGHGKIVRASNGDNRISICCSKMSSNGDFLSPECIQILEDSDIVVTNLPFSQFRTYIKTMVEHHKDFIVIGGKNGGKYQDTIGYIMNGTMRLGFNAGHGTMHFMTPEKEIQSIGSYWYTTLHPTNAPRPLLLKASYVGNETSYPKYINYDAIEVSKISDIPIDYKGKMGVPITFLEYYDSTKWNLYGTNATVLENAPQDEEIKANSHLYRRHNLYLLDTQGDYKYKRVYDRLIIQKKTTG